VATVVINYRKNLKIGMVNGLAATTCPLNSKLCAEDRLVDVLGVSHNYLRAVLNELSEEGILVRRRPVGTFLVRRPEPIPPEQIPIDMPLNLQKILPELLIEEEKPKGVPPVPVPTPMTIILPRQQKIQFWGVNQWQGQAPHIVQLGMMQAAMRLGVNLTFNALETEAGLLTYDQVRAKMRQDPPSICIVPVEWRENFAPCFEDRPTLYLDLGSMMTPEQTNVGLDAFDMIDQALNIFAETGLKRIAMAAITKERVESDWYYRNLTGRYRNFMAAHQLDEGCISFIKIQLDEVLEAARSMLEEYNPEAIYVHDDFLLPGIALELKRYGLQPGRDIAVITMSNLGLPLPPEYDWTTLQNDLKELGEQALTQAALYAGGIISQLPSIWLKPRRHWGNTHLLQKGQPDSSAIAAST